MKTLAAFLLISAVVVSCDDMAETPNCLEVSLVDELCGHAVLKIENPAYFHLGENWKGHQNVFLTMLTCEDMAKAKEGKFMVEFLDAYNPGDCAVCLAMIDYQGDKKYPVRMVEVCHQDGD